MFNLTGGTFDVTRPVNFETIGVQSGATAIGNGTVNGTLNVAGGGTVSPGTSVGTLTMGSLILNDASVLAFELDTPDTVGLTNDLIVVTGNLTLDGVLNVTDLPNFGNGVYTLIQYGTLVADNGLVEGTMPAGFTYSINAGTLVANAVTLSVAGGAAGNIQFWDGIGPFGNGTVDGGTGIWNAGNTNWTDADGNTINAWNGNFAVFGGAAGVVTVEGPQTFTGMQFLADGYEIAAGAGGGLVTNTAVTNMRVGAGVGATIAAPISGTGGIVKQEGGTLTLSGINTYTGATNVNAGTLNVAGSLVSDVTVNAGGTLAGIGTTGGLTLNSGGTLSPGNSIGTLTVSGNATFNSGSTYEVEIAAPNQADLIDVTGTATINGGQVQVTKLSTEDSYQGGQTYRIIAANGGVVRNADFTFANPFLFLSSELVYGANNVDIVLTAGGPAQDFTTVAQSFNQLQSATGLNGLEQSGDALSVYNALLALTDADAARRAFDLASGELHASAQHVIDQAFGMFSRTLRRQGTFGLGIGVNGGRVYTAPLAYSPPARSGPGIAAINEATSPAYINTHVSQAWVAPLGGRGTIDSDGNAGALDWWTAGIAGGYEGVVDVARGQAFAGFGFGYLRSHGSVGARLSTMDADGIYLGAYGGWAGGPWSLTGTLAYAANRVSTSRRIIFGAISRTAEADYWTHTIGFSGEAAYALARHGGFTVSPVATLDTGWSGHGGFTETGAGALNLTAASESWTRLDTGFGLALSHSLVTETARVTLEGRALWEHAFANTVPSQALAFAGSPTGFTVRGPNAGRDRLRVGFGAGVQISEDMTIRARYDGVFSSNQHSHGASVGLNRKF